MEKFRFKGVVFFAIGLIAVFLQGCGATGTSTFSPAFQAISPTQIAVVSVSGDIRGEAPKNQVEDFFAMEMMQKGYRIVERTRVESILAEQDFQRSEVTTAQGAAEIGRVLNVSAVVMLDVSVSGEQVSLTGRMVDPETAEILWIGTGRGGTGKTLATITGAAVGAVGGSRVRGSSRVPVTIAGGVLGGAVGHALAPEVADIVQRAIREMVKDIPRR